MNRRFSIYLDLMRFLAAFVVVLSHFAYPRFSDGTWLYIRELNLGSDAVVIFFVLSGFVIAYVAGEKEEQASTFFFNRATRIYSVAIPAVVLTLLLDTLGSSANPAAYDGWWYHQAPISDTIWNALTFTNEWGFSSFRIGTNGPYWSVGYEVWYYVIFGLAFYYKSPLKYPVLIALALLIGPKILLLMPAWLFGVGVYRLVKSGLQLSHPASLALAILPVVLYILAQSNDLQTQMLSVTKLLLGSEFIIQGLKFSDEFVWNAFVGILASLHFTGIALLTNPANMMINSPVAKSTNKPWHESAIRWLAGGTFSLYLVHYPLLQFVDAMLPDKSSFVRDIVLLLVVLLGCYLFAALFERTLRSQRKFLAGFAMTMAEKYRNLQRTPI